MQTVTELLDSDPMKAALRKAYGSKTPSRRRPR